jgi:class 3 adenylate cyclase
VRGISTVLLVDTVESTATVARLGQERGQQIAARALDALRSAAEAHDGRVVRSLGDGLLVTFATAAAALDAAAEMHRAVAERNRAGQLDAAVQVRVTIAASDVVMEDDEITGGLAPVLAARLEEVAGPGETLCTEVVRLLAQGWGSHRFEPLEPLGLRGLTEPVQVYRVAVPVADVLGMPSALAAPARYEFVGRDAELATIRREWDAAVAHDGGLVIVSGEPGVGKSRCCREFAHAVRSEGAVVLHGACAEQAGFAFQPIIQALRHCVARVADPATVLGPGAAHLARLVPEITSRQPGIATPPPTDAETGRHLLFEAVLGWLVELSRHAPTLFLVDDVSWADSATLSLLRHAMAEIAGERILIVATYRPADATPDARRFVHEHSNAVTEVRLGGLGGEEPVDFAERLLAGRLDAAARDLVASVSDRVGGNPLYLGEMIPHLSARAELERRGPDGWTARADHDPLAVATAVGDVISDRIDRLGDATRGVLLVAAVIGPSFWPDLVIDLTDASPLSVVTALEEAEEAALVRAADGNDREGSYEFAHAIYRDLLYAGLPPLRRAVEHHRVGEAIERVYASQPEPWLELLAYQFEHGHDDEDRRKAIVYLRAAAAQAQQRLANDQAAALYRRALDLADHAEPPDPHQRCDLLIELGNAERRAGLPRARRTLLEAVDSAITLSDGASAARAAFGAGRGGIFNMAGSIDTERVGVLRRTLDLVGPDPTPQRARLLAALSAELLFDDDPTAAERASDEALRIARELGDAPTLVTVMTLRMVALWRPDTVEKRLHLGAELDAIREAAGAERSGQFLGGMTHYCQAAMEGGEWELADRLLPWIDETASRLRQPTTVGYAKLRLASRACIAGHFETAELLAREAYELTAQAGQTDAEAFYLGNVFGIRLHQGRLGEVVDDMERCARTFPGVRAFLGGAAAGAAEIGDLDRCRALFDELAAELDSIRFDLNWLTTIAMAAQTAAELHDVARAAHIRDLLLPYRHQFVDNTSTFFGSVEHFLGMVSAVLDDWAGVDQAFTAATRAHEALGSPPLLARTQLEYARALSHRDPVPVAQVVALGRAAQASAERHGLAGIAARSAGLLRRVGVALA